MHIAPDDAAAVPAHNTEGKDSGGNVTNMQGPVNKDTNQSLGNYDMGEHDTKNKDTDEADSTKPCARKADCTSEKASGGPINSPDPNLVQQDTECVICGKKNARACNRCHQIYYCSKACQEIDWSCHKLLCKTAKAHPSRQHEGLARAILLSENGKKPQWVYVAIEEGADDEEFEKEDERRWLNCEDIVEVMSDLGETKDGIRPAYI